MYKAPINDISNALNAVAGLSGSIADGKMGELSDDLVTAILEEAAKFANEQVAPLNRVGDLHGAKLDNAEVTTPPGWKETYKAWCDGGWNSLMAPEQYGGQGLPMMMSIATIEMWNSAAMAFGLGPLLTIGAIEAIEAHASEEIKQTYLPKLVTGEWMGTMNLTESHSGSYLAALRSRAEPVGDGSYKVFGQKIFITYGEHDLTENICHLVLARLDGAPEGVKGISLFLVPKFLVNDDGTLGKRNDAFCQSLEHKLGIHASPTCVMIYGDGFEGSEPGAIGYLIGEQGRGLACMFTMMNNARLNVATQGVAIGEAAYQHALAYANERTQGYAPTYEGSGMAPIVHHPDIARTLLSMKTMVQAARGICYSCAHANDMANLAKEAGDKEEHRKWAERGDLLTPIAKSFATDIGVEVASMGVQVHGGMGFIEETGAAQFLRDARINPIYEGTNGIQSLDLVMRKLPLSGGDAARSFLDEMEEVAEQVRKSNAPEFGSTASRLSDAILAARECAEWMLQAMADGKQSEVLAGTTPFQRLIGLAVGGTYLAKAGLGGEDKNRRELARYFAENHLAECTALKSTVTEGAQSTIIAHADLLSA